MQLLTMYIFSFVWFFLWLQCELKWLMHCKKKTENYVSMRPSELLTCQPISFSSFPSLHIVRISACKLTTLFSAPKRIKQLVPWFQSHCTNANNKTNRAVVLVSIFFLIFWNIIVCTWHIQLRHGSGEHPAAAVDLPLFLLVPLPPRLLPAYRCRQRGPGDRVRGEAGRLDLP